MAMAPPPQVWPKVLRLGTRLLLVLQMLALMIPQRASTAALSALSTLKLWRLVCRLCQYNKPFELKPAHFCALADKTSI
jgi:hypothetical protein